MKVNFSDEIRSACPAMRVMTVEADVVNSETSAELSALLDEVAAAIERTYRLEDIKLRPGIEATRLAYKATGKDPNRYRPASEQLCRRVVRGLGLYRVNTLVDIINVLSLESGYSIGGFDRDSIEGDAVTLGVGREGEPYEGIGRGPLNIAGLPVYRDAVGGIGTPTSDNERTKLSLSTRRLFMTVNIFATEIPDEEFEARTRELLTRFCNSKEIKFTTYEHI